MQLLIDVSLRVLAPTVTLTDGGRWRMYLVARRTADRPAVICSAVSDDLLNWTREVGVRFLGFNRVGGPRYVSLPDSQRRVLNAKPEFFGSSTCVYCAEWEPHQIRQGDGAGGWVTRKAQRQPRITTGQTFAVECNNWVDRDDKGAATAILEIGWHLKAGRRFPVGPYTSVFRRSVDGGKTWIDEFSPDQWQFTVEHNGKRWVRGTSEGSLVRAANGDLVAALRTDMPPRYFDGVNDDSLEGFAAEDRRTGTSMRLRRYSYRMDGFVSVSARNSAGEVLTKPLKFSGDRLVV